MPKLIATPLWEEIAGNYAAGARADLDRLMATQSLDGGRLILWQGYLVDILFLEPRRDRQGQPKARLLVLEDAGELVAAEARAETGKRCRGC